MEKEKEEMKYPTRGPLSDKILLLMSDGKPRKTAEIKDAINWTKKTDIANTLSDLKLALVENRDPRRLKKFKSDNCNKGFKWQLIDQALASEGLPAAPCSLPNNQKPLNE